MCWNKTKTSNERLIKEDVPMETVAVLQCSQEWFLSYYSEAQRAVLGGAKYKQAPEYEYFSKEALHRCS